MAQSAQLPCNAVRELFATPGGESASERRARVPATLFKQRPFNQHQGEERQVSQYVWRLPGGPCDTIAPSMTRSLYNCFTRLPLSVHDELMQASAQNLTELLFRVEQILTRYQIPLH